MINPSFRFNIISCVVLGFIVFFMFLPQLIFIILSFVKSFPNNMSFSFDNIINLFSNRNGRGVMHYLGNSLLMSFGVGVIGTIISYGFGYLSVRNSAYHSFDQFHMQLLVLLKVDYLDYVRMRPRK